MNAPRYWSGFTQDVVLERARLAIVDPDGEADAVAPLPLWRAVQIVAAMEALEARPRRLFRAIDRGAAWDNDAVLAALNVQNTNAGHGVVVCPVHADEHPSLSWKIAGDRLLLNCFAGCTFDEIIGAVA